MAVKYLTDEAKATLVELEAKYETTATVEEEGIGTIMHKPTLKIKLIADDDKEIESQKKEAQGAG